MGIRSIAALCLICWPAIAAGQVSGEFHLEKSVYALGEPIFVYFQVVNHGSKVERLYSSDPNSACSAYWMKVSSDHARSSCGLNALNCLFSDVELQPGEKYIERVLLNFARKIDAPGDYWVEVGRRAPFSNAKDGLEVNSTLYFQVDETPAQSEVFQPFLDQLKSTNPIKRVEAARTLASAAPRYLEDALLTFADADDPLVRQWAPLAFHRLNTPRSRAAMADFLDKTRPGTWEHWKAAQYLANEKCGDEF
jgi:hypothetical protein